MGKLFDLDSPFMAGLTKIADIIILNALFLVCSLPMITIGASATAMYYVTLKMVKNEECYIVKSFFKSFKLNFLQATGIWLLSLLAGAVIYIDVKIVSGQYEGLVSIPDGIAKVMIVFLIAAAVFFMFTVSFVFPQLAKFDNTVKNTIRNAFLMSVSHFPTALAVIAITIIPILIVFLVPVFTVFIFIIFGLIAYCNSFLFVRIYKRYIPETEIVGDEDFSIAIEEEGSVDES